MNLQLATSNDSERLKHFFNQSRIPGPVELRFDRTGDYFAPYKIQSEKHSTFFLEDDKGDIIASASLLFKQGWINGETQKICYATDLRVAPKRKAIIHWTKHYLPALERAKAEFGVNYFFSAVPKLQTQAFNAFVRPRSNKRQLPRYYLFRNYESVNIHGLLPFSVKPLSSIQIRNAKPSDLEALADFIASKKKTKPISFCQDSDDFLDQLQKWEGLNIQDFKLALDGDGQIVGCVAPWSTDHIQKTYAESYSQKAETLRGSLKGLSWVRMAHKLPKAGRSFKTKYLTHFLSNHPEIFYALMHKVYKESPRDELLMYRHFEGHLPSVPPKTFITTSLKYGLYCVLSPKDPVPDFLKPSTTQPPPDFELLFM